MQLLIIFVLLSVFENAIHLKIGVAAQDDEDPANFLRIIGGNEVKNIKSYAFTAVIIEEWGHVTTFLCACAKVARRWALTTANCISSNVQTSFDAGTLMIRGNTLKWKTSGHDDHFVKKIAKHPKFNIRTSDYDVAILQVQEPFQRFSWLAIPPTDLLTKGKDATALGWGSQTMDGFGDVLGTLYAVTVQIQDWGECRKFFGGNLTERMFCAGYKFQGPCTHDKGGPIYRLHKGYKYLIGLVSFTWEDLCGITSYTNIFTNLWSVKSWISKFIVEKKDQDEPDDDDDFDDFDYVADRIHLN